MKKTLETRGVLLTVSSILLISLACGVIGTPAEPPNQVETIVAGTLQALTQPVSPTVSFTTTPQAIAPTNTLQPVASPTSTSQLSQDEGAQILFTAGATTGVVEGTIQANQKLHYYLRASQGQPMITIVNSTNNDVTMSIHGHDGTLLLPASQRQTIWQGTLSGTQNYYFTLNGGASAQTFTLSVNIPARIEFDPGTNSSRLSGRTVNGYAVTYVLRASAGQTLEATINTSPNDAALTIWGFTDGQPYARAQNGVTNFSMELPSTQDYIIDVVPQGGRIIDYILTVSVK
jgi:hypothetical protein